MTTPRPIEAVLADFRGLPGELSDSLARLAQLTRDRGGPSALTIKLTLKPEGDGVVVTPSVQVKEPEPSRHTPFFFVAPDGSLVRDDPNQPRLDFNDARDVTDPTRTDPREPRP